MKILVTGCAGFIGSHVCQYLLKNDYQVLGIDNLNDYYDPEIKRNNLEILYRFEYFTFKKEDIYHTDCIKDFKPDKVVHLASMAGVRFSIENPHVYTKVNIDGFVHIMNECIKHNVRRVVYASSSSVYGLNKKLPFSEDDHISTCNSPYACSKMAMELYATMFHQLYGISTIGLRFFTVYGPRGRPDMAVYKFLKRISEQKAIDKYGDGESSRDYTYIDDIVQGIVAALENEYIECDIYNLGNNNPVSLNTFIKTCESVTGKQAIINRLPEQLGDVPHTCADISKAMRDLNYHPKISLSDGLENTWKSIMQQYS